MKEAGKQLSHATWITLCNIERECNPNTWDDDDDDEFIDTFFDWLSHCSYIKGAKEWVREKLDDDPREVAYEWGLPKPDEERDSDDREFEGYFTSKEELLNNIDWAVVSFVAKNSLKDCTDKETVDQMRKICEQLDSMLDE